MTVLAERPVAAPATTAGALAIRAEQTMWTPEQAAVLRQSGIGESVTNAELAGFLHLCQRTGLDPFSRQIYLIGRWDRKANREVFTPQTGIDGYRVVARRATAKTGGTYGYEDTLWCDASGRWRDVWLENEPPAAAKVTVTRDGARFSAVARFSEYVQTNREGKPLGLWGKMPASQIAKCCEALALRKAFPHDLAGVYTAEEMQQADNPEPQFARQAPSQDAWETAAPARPAEPVVQQTPPDVVAAGVADVPPESLTPAGRDYLHEAMAAPDAATVRQIWQDARAEGARPGYLDQIAEVGKGKAAAEAAQPSEQQQRVAEQARAVSVDGDDPATGDGAEPPVYTGPDDAARAEERLRIAASRAHLTTVDADFQRVYGLPIDQATAGQLNAFADRIKAAGGQQ